MALESFLFSTAEIAPADRFGAYHDLYARGADVGRVEDGFEAEVRGFRFERMLVYDRRISAALHTRGNARVRRDGFDHFTLQLLVSGELVSDGATGHNRLASGDILLADMSLPSGTRVQQTRLITVSLARELVETAAPEPRLLHGLVLPAGQATLVADFVLSLARRAGSLSAGWASGAPKALGHLLGATLAEASRGDDEPLRVLEEYRLERIQAVIEAHLGECDLDVDRIAAKAALSRTALYRAFEPLGGVSRYVLARRLARLRSALSRLGEHRSVAALAFACGFASESHCNRAFRKAFGLPPGQFRNEVLRERVGARDSSAPAGGLPASWMRELY